MISAILASHCWDEGIHHSITQLLRNLARSDEFNTHPAYLNQALKMWGTQACAAPLSSLAFLPLP